MATQQEIEEQARREAARRTAEARQLIGTGGT